MSGTGAASGTAPREAVGTAPDIVIIFGAGVRPDGSPSPTLAWRVEAAHRWGEARPGQPFYMPTGGIGRFGPSEASVMAGLLREAGVPPGRIIPEPTARDTLDSIFACRALLRQRRHGQVWAATSAYHLPRCLLLLRLAGVAARAVPPPPHPASRNVLRRWRWRLREVPAVPVDVLLLLLRRLRGS
jgi:uncharacterized SAM-binding protein YcdF (DUF218 family)